jgi:hypothetical protein
LAEELEEEKNDFLLSWWGANYLEVQVTAEESLLLLAVRLPPAKQHPAQSESLDSFDSLLEEGSIYGKWYHGSTA